MCHNGEKTEKSIVLPQEANNNNVNHEPVRVEPIPGASQYVASQQVDADDMNVVEGEVVEDVIIQDTSEFDTEAEEINEIYVSDDEPTKDTTSSVEIISLSLITIRNESNGIKTVKREHHCYASTHHDPRNFDWRGIIGYMEGELCRHAEALRERMSMYKNYSVNN